MAATPSIRDFVIAASNKPPQAVDDSFRVVAEFGLFTGNVLANDSDPEGHPLAASAVSGPTNGALTLDPDGSSSCQHDGSETTNDSFTCRASDGEATDDATVTITVTPVNNLLLPQLEANVVPEGSTNMMPVAANDIDPDGPVPLVPIIIRQVRHGFLGVNPDRTLTYTHDCSETTNEGFVYKVNDGLADSPYCVAAAITITPLPDPHFASLVDPGQPSTSGSPMRKARPTGS